MGVMQNPFRPQVVALDRGREAPEVADARRAVIRWTDDELQFVAREMVRLARERGLNPATTGEFRDLAIFAQMGLPRERRRPGHMLARSLNVRLDAAVKAAARAPVASAPAAATAQADTPVPSVALAASVAPAPASKPAHLTLAAQQPPDAHQVPPTPAPDEGPTPTEDPPPIDEPDSPGKPVLDPPSEDTPVRTRPPQQRRSTGGPALGSASASVATSEPATGSAPVRTPDPASAKASAASVAASSAASSAAPSAAPTAASPTVRAVPVAPTDAISSAAVSAFVRHAVAAVVTPLPSPGPAPADSIEGALQSLSRAVAQAIARETISAIKLEFQREFPALVTRATELTRQLPRVLVIGPLSRQQEELETAVEGLLDVRFVQSDEGAQLVRSRGKHCVAAVLMADFVSHAHQNAAVQQFGRDRVRVVHGGMDKVRAVLEEVALAMG